MNWVIFCLLHIARFTWWTATGFADIQSFISSPTISTLSEALMKLNDDFRNDLIPLLDGLSANRLPPGKYFKFFEHEGKALAFPNAIYPNYLALKRMLRLRANTSGKLISDDALEGKLTDFLFRIKYASDQSKVRSEIQKEIALLLKDVKNMQSMKTLFIIPIMNLQVEENVIIGDSSIVSFSLDILAALEAKYKLKFKFEEKSIKDSVLRIPEENQTRTVAIVVAEAPDEKKALELAIQKAETCLNILRLYGSGTSFVIREEYIGSITQRLIKVNLTDGTYGEIASALNVGNHFPTILTKNLISELKTNVLPKIDALLVKEEDSLTSLQDDLLKAILWFGNSVKENQRNMKFVKAITALETLLIPDGGTAKLDVIAKRFASITFKSATDEKKKEVFSEMRSMYQLRSAIIHSGEGYVYEDDLQKAMLWVQTTIQILLERADKYPKLQDAITKEFPITEKLYSQPFRRNIMKKIVRALTRHKDVSHS